MELVDHRTEKKCGCCQRIKAAAEYRVDPRNGLLQSYCRSCFNERRRALREQRGYISSGASQASRKKWADANPDKRRAQGFVSYAIKRGLLVRPERCESCAKLCKPHAHHDDYSRPLDVRWLCSRCHGREHWDISHTEPATPKAIRKLSAADAIEIRVRRSAGERAKDLAAEFGVSSSAISMIASNQRWASV